MFDFICESSSIVFKLVLLYSVCLELSLKIEEKSELFELFKECL